MGRKSKTAGTKQDPRTGKWSARIKVDGEEIFLGSFETQDEAHAAYAARKAEVDEARREARVSAKLAKPSEPADTAPVETATSRRQCGVRHAHMGCFFSDTLGKWVAKSMERPDKFVLLGHFDTLEEADAAHAQAHAERLAKASDPDADTPEEAVLAGCQRLRHRFEMELEDFRHHIVANSPYAIGYLTPFADVIWDEMLQARAGYRIALGEGRAPRIVFTVPAVAA